ncbi:hypothetical protein BDV38DRAFT_264222 [Aspergillus pseudotamarii]|uniref:Uncharacterized protein n=1 Tax=Aspergillus pseudotamarii TaxID=132259 RepID=A0A5N6S9X1_ASPPS|nr:uncharacterized protein BDV38DRAFT_264222 [Aspergillus pseudotamarii]KAE8131482.1 hypothetical protein BDV38DRAFT_264222 [Aspergillus pseudotamarii]
MCSIGSKTPFMVFPAVALRNSVLLPVSIVTSTAASRASTTVIHASNEGTLIPGSFLVVRGILRVCVANQP